MRPMMDTQRGVTLLIALIILIAMTLAGLALFRQVGTGVIVARNLTFREAALAAADRGVEAARTWLTAQAGATLQNGNKDAGYYAAWCNVSLNDQGIPDANEDGNPDDCGVKPSTDPDPAPPSTFLPTSYNWNNAVHITGANGDQIDYVIHRMCGKPGDINIGGQQCVLIQKDGSPQKMDLPSGQPPISGTIQPYYRVTTRVVGLMNTVVFTQVMIY